MVSRQQILSFLDQTLQPHLYRDYAPNGLQISGAEEISRVISGVSANKALIEAAIEHEADLLLVHHGYFWKGEDPCLIGPRYERIKLLMAHNINLIAYHLPLDGHPEFGNNAELGKLLDINVEGQLSSGETPALTWYGDFNDPMSGEQLSQKLEAVLGQTPFHIAGQHQEINKVAWCTGAAQDFIQTAVDAGCQAYITGEVSERIVDIARETGIHFFAAGHYATERYGIMALGNLVSQSFDLPHEFIEIHNPI